MPLYEYACLKCGRHTDKIEPVKGPHLKKCPHCGGKVESVITAPAIKFKGSGWYVNDYAAKTPAGESKKPDGSSSSDSKESSSLKDSGGKDSNSKDSSSKESSSKDSSSKDGGSKESPSSSKDAKEKKSPASKKD